VVYPPTLDRLGQEQGSMTTDDRDHRARRRSAGILEALALIGFLGIVAWFGLRVHAELTATTPADTAASRPLPTTGIPATDTRLELLPPRAGAGSTSKLPLIPPN
jgi:hypothetical protein